jgi:hypothetical protein
VVDARLLLPGVDRLLPRKLGGIFGNPCEERSSQLVAHASVRHTISGSLDFAYYSEVSDHCNGLLLLDNDNVALPTRPPGSGRACPAVARM